MNARGRNDVPSVSPAINWRINRFKVGFGTWNAPTAANYSFPWRCVWRGKEKAWIRKHRRKEGKLLINNYRPTRPRIEHVRCVATWQWQWRRIARIFAFRIIYRALGQIRVFQSVDKVFESLPSQERWTFQLCHFINCRILSSLSPSLSFFLISFVTSRTCRGTR